MEVPALAGRPRSVQPSFEHRGILQRRCVRQPGTMLLGRQAKNNRESSVDFAKLAELEQPV